MAGLRIFWKFFFVVFSLKRTTVPTLACFLLFAGACTTDFSPKQRGYYHIKLPPKEYLDYQSSCPFVFQYPAYAQIIPDASPNAKSCWFDLAYSQFNARLHLSYQPITSRTVFDQLVEDSRTFAFKHTVKATSIDEGYISLPEHRVFGILYKIGGNTASAIQFFLTDSTEHYLRGALYFHEKPQRDSIQPVIDFLAEDIEVMIKSLRWK